MKAGSGRICASAGCDTCLSRYAPAGLEVCGACEKRLAEAARLGQGRGQSAARRRPPRPETPPGAVGAEHAHFGPVVQVARVLGDRIEWRPATPWTTGAIMITETCGCQTPRYELMRLGGRRLIRRTLAQTGATHETAAMPVREASDLWNRLLAGYIR